MLWKDTYVLLSFWLPYSILPILLTLDDNHSHSAVYGSRSSSQLRSGMALQSWKAFVWAISHVHAYLYDNNVTVYTDHFAVKAAYAIQDGGVKCMLVEYIMWQRIHLYTIMWSIQHTVFSGSVIFYHCGNACDNWLVFFATDLIRMIQLFLLHDHLPDDKARKLVTQLMILLSLLIYFVDSKHNPRWCCTAFAHNYWKKPL